MVGSCVDWLVHSDTPSTLTRSEGVEGTRYSGHVDQLNSSIVATRPWRACVIARNCEQVSAAAAGT